MAIHSGTGRLDYISLCTGGAGLDIGLELAIPCARAVVCIEREAFAVAHLVAAMQKGLLAQAPIWSDARTFNGRPWRGLVDGVIGGIPCQPHSVAGRKRGQNDERDLWSATRRIIVQARPWFVLIENVSGMLSAGDDEIAGAERVRGDLRKLGYSVEGGLFTAEEVGASHQRERLFILGILDNASGRRERRVSGNLSGAPYADDSGGQTGRNRNTYAAIESMAGVGLADADIIELRGQSPAGEQPLIQQNGGISLFPPGPGDADGWRRVIDRSPELEPAFRRMAHGVASGLGLGRVDRLRLLGNGVVPLAAAHAVCTLGARLGAAGAAGADRLVRLIGR